MSAQSFLPVFFFFSARRDRTNVDIGTFPRATRFDFLNGTVPFDHAAIGLWTIAFAMSGRKLDHLYFPGFPDFLLCLRSVISRGDVSGVLDEWRLS